jgi:hypothetical protein
MPDIHYSSALENLLKAQGEECLALRWAHDEAQRFCSRWDSRFQIPSIILSFLSGTGAVGGQALLPFEGGMILVGFVSVFVGILGSVQSYLAYAKKGEAHRIAALNYERLHRELAIELALPRAERQPAEKLLEKLRAEIDTLNETAPLLPDSVKAKFKENFKELGDYNLPPSLNGLDPILIAPEPVPKTPLPEAAPRPDIKIKVMEV